MNKFSDKSFNIVSNFYTKSNIGLDRPQQANLNVWIHIIQI